MTISKSKKMKELLPLDKTILGLKNSLTRYQLNKYMYCFMLIVLIFVVMFISNTQHLYSYDFKRSINFTKNVQRIINISDEYNQIDESIKQKHKREMKYILLWTTDTATPFIYFGKGQSVFKDKKCKWTNCYITSDRNYLGFYTEFDIIAFNGPQLPNIANIHSLPIKRSIHQKYVYTNIEAAANYPIITNMWNGFFNWTWTYKLNSDAIWGYVAIRNSTNAVIGPNANMHWIPSDNMEPTDYILKERLKTKTKAAAWFSSNCNTLSQREERVTKIQEALHKYNLDVDIYGTCGKYQCPREIMNRCLKILEKHYYFYFAFENALSEDYVTEKIVYALSHYTVPVVFGGANYSRFMPDGIYLNALELGPQELAKKMNDAIQNPTIYRNFFKWRKYYSFHFRNNSPDTDDYCRFCAMVNDDALMKSTTVYQHFDEWWTGQPTLA